MMSEHTVRRVTRTLILFGVLVIIWRVVTGLGRLSIGAPGGASGGSMTLGLALGLMGLLFVLCGLAAWFRMRTAAAALFAFYGVFYGLHWGGVIYAEDAWFDNAFRLLHLVLSGILSQAFLFHFALLYTQAKAILDRRLSIYILYAPAAVVVLVMLVTILLQGNATVLAELEGWLQLSETIFTNVYFLFAALAIWAGWWRTDRESRRETGISLAAGGLLVSISPYLASIIGNAAAPAPWIYQFGAAPYTLFFSFIPITFLIAMLRNHGTVAKNVARRGMPAAGVSNR